VFQRLFTSNLPNNLERRGEIGSIPKSLDTGYETWVEGLEASSLD
jgi:hypothetical protein